jgi:hypothetical protein
MMAEELYVGYRWMYKRFYSISNIIQRYLKEKAQHKPYLLLNLLYRKYFERLIGD